MTKASLVLFGHRDAYKFLGVSKTTFDKLVLQYDIPFHQTSSGRIFVKSDLETFQKSEERKGNLKHREKK